MNAPRLSELTGYLIRVTPRSFDMRPALNPGDHWFEVMTADVTVIAPPRGERHMAISVRGTAYVLPTSFEGCLIAARGLVETCRREGIMWGRPYRYELQPEGDGVRRRAWAFNYPTHDDVRLIDDYLSEHES